MQSESEEESDEEESEEEGIFLDKAIDRVVLDLDTSIQYPVKRHLVVSSEIVKSDSLFFWMCYKEKAAGNAESIFADSNCPLLQVAYRVSSNS